jgi:predicted GNAT family N-acyltransferase
MPTLREIDWGSTEYRAQCALRDRYLRQPLGLRLGDEDLDSEREQRHFCLYDGTTLIAAACVIQQDQTTAQLRQMVVEPAAQGRGHGRRIVGEIEHLLLQGGIDLLFLHARKTAIGFYTACGFEVVGPEFMHATLVHVRMEKHL